MGWPIDRPTGLTHHDPAKSSKGYTLMCGTGARDAVLLDMQGRVVHRWYFSDKRVFNVELLPTGNLLALVTRSEPPPPRTDGEQTRFSLDPGGPPEIFNFLGGRGDALRELDWEGNAVWEYEHPGLHHDFDRLENGHTIALEWVPTTKEVEERVLGGGHQPGQPMPPNMIGDDFVELDADAREVGRIHLWRVLSPEDAVIGPLESRWEWTHVNSIERIPDGGLLFSSRNTSTIGIVDPPSADDPDSPGALRWRFGGPELSCQHHATWQGSAADGSVLVFDNGMNRLQDLSYSRILLIDPRTDEFEVVYQGEPREQFFSAHISGVSKLSNGNYLVTEGAAGRLFEIDSKGAVVWEWVSPFQVTQRGDVCNWVFRAWRYDGDFPGLAGRELRAERHAEFNRLHGLDG